MKILLSLAACSALISVVLGAFAAHGLKSKLSETLLNTFQTGVQYQMYHSLALILLVILYRQMPQSLLFYSAGFMFAGIILFSGSLYMLALTQIKWFGPITPIGGVCFIVGWALLAAAALKGAS
ncbi:DUF423 domain-containing protein [Paraglaciecola psychrophila]|uniref:DUF423 domain-containing protein n=1 Tax=Paraglaciecola psychrophila 170 TaxID=1129794 RepID=K6ZUG0_9ALTE|nr:DUF423 domain-containing protein [Paraglaciecola psychrophila]AGH45235.1 hypothetical protein C427_3126 [Paraglaciecola psychrophila 170]GAC39531.1 hypothetical protein GPSY_3920 [Paraglaciecola psychrophila 170]